MRLYAVLAWTIDDPSGAGRGVSRRRGGRDGSPLRLGRAGVPLDEVPEEPK